jgi:hypothetical protein
VFGQGHGRKTGLDIWRDVYSESDDVNMVSPDWIEAFLVNYEVETENGYFLAIYMKDSPIGIVFLNSNYVRRHYMVISRGLFVNISGNEKADNVWVEHNYLCCRSQYKDIATKCLLKYMVNNISGWDEIYFNGIDGDSILFSKLMELSNDRHKLIITRSEKNYAVDLPDSETRENYLGTFKKKERKNILRILKTEIGDRTVSFSAAGDLEEAMDWLDRLSEYNKKRFSDNENKSAFFDNKFSDFHKAYVRRAWKEGEVIFLRLRIGEEVISYRYLLARGKNILCYQFGFNYDANIKHPGVITNHYTIEWCMKNGYSVVDYLGGEGDHKRLMANSNHEKYIIWCVIRKKNLIFKAENALLTYYKYFKEFHEKGKYKLYT